MSENEPPPTDEELREATALAEALEGRPALPPAGVLEVAALLQASSRPSALDPALATAQLASLSRGVRRPLSARVRVLVPSMAIAASLILATLYLGRHPSGPMAAARPLPSPPVALIEAQLRATSPAATPDGELETQMRQYRARLLAELAYGWGGMR